jgi:PKD repeat protein
VAGEPVTFDASGSSDPDGTIFTHTWRFGDGTTLGGETVQHTYASGDLYNVILTVTDTEGASKSTTTVADIGTNSLRPTADANGSYNGRVGVAVTFDGTGSVDSDGTISQYAWDFGDDTPVIMGTATPSHIYAAAGTYYVVLTVTDDTGETDVDVTTVTVGIGNVPPLADAGDSVSGKGLRITFDGTRSSDPDGNIVSYAWRFGDGSTGTGPTPTHTYATPGAYFVILTVTDNDFATDSDATLAITSNPAFLPAVYQLLLLSN